MRSVSLYYANINIHKQTESVTRKQYGLDSAIVLSIVGLVSQPGELRYKHAPFNNPLAEVGALLHDVIFLATCNKKTCLYVASFATCAFDHVSETKLSFFYDFWLPPVTYSVVT